MSDQINLLTHKRKRYFNREALIQLCHLLARILIVFVLITTILLFILNRNPQLSVLLQQDKTISSNLSFVQQKIIKFLLIRDRLSDIKPFIENPFSLDTTLADLSSAIPTSAKVNAFEYSKTHIAMTLTSPSVTDLNDFINYLTRKVNDKQVFQKVTITRFTSDPNNGVYMLVLQGDLL